MHHVTACGLALILSLAAARPAAAHVHAFDFGKTADVVFGFDDVSGFESKDNGYFGATVGRYANRIAGGKFTLDGKEYQLATNDGPNHLHGGNGRSLDKAVWKAVRFPKI